MQHFHRDGQDYWGGIHQELGLLIYDPRDQQRLATDNVRLYVVTEHRLATFVKDRVRARAGPQPSGHLVVSAARRGDAATPQCPGHLVQPPGRRRHLVHRAGHPHRRRRAGRTPYDPQHRRQP